MGFPCWYNWLIRTSPMYSPVGPSIRSSYISSILKTITCLYSAIFPLQSRRKIWAVANSILNWMTCFSDIQGRQLVTPPCFDFAWGRLLRVQRSNLYRWKTRSGLKASLHILYGTRHHGWTIRYSSASQYPELPRWIPYGQLPWVNVGVKPTEIMSTDRLISE